MSGFCCYTFRNATAETGDCTSKNLGLGFGKIRHCINVTTAFTNCIQIFLSIQLNHSWCKLILVHFWPMLHRQLFWEEGNIVDVQSAAIEVEVWCKSPFVVLTLKHSPSWKSTILYKPWCLTQIWDETHHCSITTFYL